MTTAMLTADQIEAGFEVIDEAAQKAECEFRELAIRLVEGTPAKPADVQNILRAAGRSMHDLKGLIATIRKGKTAVEQLEQAEALEGQLPELDEKAGAIADELARLEEEHRRTMAPLREELAAISRTKTSLRQQIDDLRSLGRSTLSGMRPTDSRLEFDRRSHRATRLEKRLRAMKSDAGNLPARIARQQQAIKHARGEAQRFRELPPSNLVEENVGKWEHQAAVAERELAKLLELQAAIPALEQEHSQAVADLEAYGQSSLRDWRALAYA